MLFSKLIIPPFTNLKSTGSAAGQIIGKNREYYFLPLNTNEATVMSLLGIS